MLWLYPTVLYMYIACITHYFHERIFYVHVPTPLQSSLQSLVSQREAMLHQLSLPVETLDQLKSTLELLHTITDMQNLIDELYLPVERLYIMLR